LGIIVILTKNPFIKTAECKNFIFVFSYDDFYFLIYRFIFPKFVVQNAIFKTMDNTTDTTEITDR